MAVSKKRKAPALKSKADLEEEEVPSTPSAPDAEEILKVMTKSLPNKLSPLGPELMRLLQKKKEPSAAEKPAEPKKQRIITVIEAIEETPYRHRPQRRKQQQPKLLPPKLLLLKLQQLKPQIWKTHSLILMK